ncbi:MAG: citramalate synthase [Armatimonadetes bacterium]|nr:citramalate synthase [Armatimonadota bacterium]
MPKIAIYDTTLRDGTQGEGVSFSAEEKLKVARKLDAFGVAYIEGGWPGSNPKDVEFFELAKKVGFETSKLTAFGSTRRANLTAAEDPQILKLIEAETPTVTLFGKSWDMHVTEVFRISLDENLEMIYDSIKYLVDNGREAIFDAEHFFDGYKRNPKYALSALDAAARAGAAVLSLCDTNGGTLPSEVADVVRVVVDRHPNISVAMHAHNDSGLAIANSVAAAQNGATQVQGTINGYGERCGNANTCAIIPILELKLGMKCVPDGALKNLTALSRWLDEIANRIPDYAMPFVGASAFAHKAGVHVDAVTKNPTTYEHVDPAEVGNRRRFLISELAGSSSVVQKARKYDIDLGKKSPEVKAVLNRVVQLEHQGYSFEDAEASFELLLKKAMGQYEKLFELVGFRLIVEKRGPQEAPITEATLKIAVDGVEAFTVAEGDGPVHALDNALRLALKQFYSYELDGIRLSDYKVRVVNSGEGTAARVRTIIESRDATDSWSTVGVSTNIIEASWHALADSVEYGLLRQK